MLKKLTALLLCLALFATVLAGCGSKNSDDGNQDQQQEADQKDPVNEPEDLKKIKVSMIGSVSFAPLYLAKALGFFEEEGLDVEFVTPGGPKGFQAMHAGEVDFCMLSQEVLLGAAEKGQESSVIATMLDSRVYGIISTPDITDVSQLKGKVVFGSDPGSAPYIFTCNVLRNAGLDPERDVTFMQMDMNAAPLAVASGEVSAAMINMFKVAEMKDVEYNVLVSTLEPEDAAIYLGSEEFPAEIVCATKEYTQENPETCQAFVNATIKAEEWIQDHTDEEVANAVAPLMADYDPEILVEQVAMMRPIFSTTGMVSEAGEQAVIDIVLEAGTITQELAYDQVVDMSFVENYHNKK